MVKEIVWAAIEVNWKETMQHSEAKDVLHGRDLARLHFVVVVNLRHPEATIHYEEQVRNV